MTALEQGFLLLSSHLGNPERKVLTTAQLRILADRIRYGGHPAKDRELTEKDLLALGYNRDMSHRIVSLLGDTGLLERYLHRGKQSGCYPITRVSREYPLILRQRLGLDSPGCLWIRGDRSLLAAAAISLVGSRDLQEPNRRFAEAVGQQAAMQGLALVSGNARGADRAAQEACLNAGGSVISFVADELLKQPHRERLVYVSEDDFDEPFSTHRALSRNRCIHALGRMTFVAQADLGKGGTWDGTSRNLHFGWSPVVCFRDGSEASQQLSQMGAYLIGTEELEDFSALSQQEITLF